MGREIKLADLAGEQVTVDLDGHRYRVLAVTRSVQKRLQEAQPLLERLDSEEDGDAVVDVLTTAIDAILAPADDDGPAAKGVLTEAWESDELSLTQLGALFERVQEASVARPT